MTEQLRSDIHFNDYAILPAETFADTMRLEYGWSHPDPTTLERYQFIADTDNVDAHIAQMTRFAAAAYRHFGGGEPTLPLPVNIEEVLRFVRDPKNQESFMVWGFEEEIAGLAHKYLNGQGEDYETFNKIF